MRKILAAAALAITVAGLTACSSSGDHDDAESAAAPTTASPTEGSGATGPVPDVCTKWSDIQVKYADTFKEGQAQPTFDPANPEGSLQQMQSVGTKLLAPMQEFQAVAPPEIKADVDSLVDGLRAVADANPEALAAAGATMSTAGTNIARYLATNCAGSAAPSTTAAGTGTGTVTGAG